ncbi:MAG: hypothetical protein D6820_02765, partial [Lentisphaerae bacterium]
GSGRKFIRMVFNGDFEINEITAHARAATAIDPECDTILEIGGQDAKFTQLKHGAVYHSVMNYVCAAGTGSFVEEQAKKLGIAVEEYGDWVMDVAPPRTSDRCTVFMERDLEVLLREGWQRRELAAAVLYSVCENYLNKVVGRRRIGDRVYFQGATARNKGLVAAFENILGKPIHVSPLCHVTGAYGVALLMLDRGIHQRPSGFVGLEAVDHGVVMSQEECRLCNNHCLLTVVERDGQRFGWGMKCGREYEKMGNGKKSTNDQGEQQRREETERLALFRLRNELIRKLRGDKPASPRLRVAVPSALLQKGFGVLITRFFHELGCSVVCSNTKTSHAQMKLGQQLTKATFCAPIIAGHGHCGDLLVQSDRWDIFFLPHWIAAPSRDPDRARDSLFCPYIEAFPSIVADLFGKYGISANRLVRPVINLSEKYSKTTQQELVRWLQPLLKLSPRRIGKAWRAALAAQRLFEQQFKAAGEATWQRIHETGEKAVVLCGRPYNIYDEGINLGLIPKIAQQGFTVIPVDALEEKEETPDWVNGYWNFGHVILRNARRVLASDQVFCIYFTNFSCGPDSFLISYFHEIMEQRQKPFLILQFDGHGADAGYVTRIESATESFHSWIPVALKEERKHSRVT